MLSATGSRMSISRIRSAVWLTLEQSVVVSASSPADTVTAPHKLFVLSAVGATITQRVDRRSLSLRQQQII